MMNELKGNLGASQLFSLDILSLRCGSGACVEVDVTDYMCSCPAGYMYDGTTCQVSLILLSTGHRVMKVG